jgi:hypothetical protein
MGKETRSAFILTDVKGILFDNVKAQKAANVPVLVLKDVSDFESRGGNVLKKDTKIKSVKNKSF